MIRLHIKPLILLQTILLLIFSCEYKIHIPTKNDTLVETNNPSLMKDSSNNNWNPLTPEEERVILYKGTEYPFTGIYTDFKNEGIFTCKRCNTALYSSLDKFNSECGWPSFDDIIDGNVKEIPDTDGRRTEIVCSKCEGHLGHVFKGEGFTNKNTRHCVNSISLNFKPQQTTASSLDTAIFASGCFWGTEFYLKQLPGVISTEVGYIGGIIKNPSYREVCTGKTGHAEATRVLFNPQIISFEKLCKYFFETHDPAQINRQGPDIGTQYRSEIFYFNESQKRISKELINLLEDKGLNVATQLTAVTTFWIAEDYHQDYYNQKGGTPYCHSYIKRF